MSFDEMPGPDDLGPIIQTSLVPNPAATNEYYVPLPSYSDAEVTVLGSIILDNSLMDQAIDVLNVDDFYSPFHRMVYESMQRLQSQGDEINPITIGDLLRAKNVLDQIGGVYRITQLYSGLPRFDSIAKFCKTIKDTSVTRKVLKLASELQRLAQEPDADINQIMFRAESEILDLRTELESQHVGDTNEGFVPLYMMIPTLKEQFGKMFRGESSGVATGMPELDRLLDGGGLQRGGLYIIAASEKAGKTSLALDWAYHIAKNLGLTVLIATLEMAKETLAKRLLSPYAQVPYYKFRPVNAEGVGMDQKTYDKVMNSLDAFGEIPIQVSSKLRTVDQIKSWARRIVNEGKRPDGREVGLLIIDYMQLVELDNVKDKNRTAIVTEISRQFKLLAQELDLPIVAMSSLNRLGLTEGQVPDSFNLRESGSIAFDCEALIFLHNPAYKPGTKYVHQNETDMDMILSRQRNGPTGTIPVKLLGPFMQFMTMSQWNKYSGTGNTPVQVQQERDSFTELWEK